MGKGNPAIIDQLILKAKERGWNATSVAVDGHSLSHIPTQLTRIPQDATHLFISIGRMRIEKIFIPIELQEEMMDCLLCNV